MTTMSWIAVAVFINVGAVSVWLFVISRFDKHRKIKGQTRLLIFFYLAGMVSAFINYLTYYPLLFIFYPLYGGTYGFDLFFFQVFVVGLGEELAKFLCFAFLVWKLKSVKELKDGILQACSVALGFAAVENFKYGWNYGLETLVKRFYNATVGHVLYAIIWGAVFAVLFLEMHDKPRKEKLKYIAASLVPAALFHGLSNFFLYVDLEIVSTLLDVLVGTIGLLIFLQLRKHSPYKNLPLEDCQTVLPHIEKALERHPQDFELNYRAGKYYLYWKKYSLSSGHFAVCREQKPNKPSVHLLYGVALLGNQNYSEGEEVLQKHFSKLTESQKYLVLKKLEPYSLSSNLEKRVYSTVGIDDWVQGYRIEKMRRAQRAPGLL